MLPEMPRYITLLYVRHSYVVQSGPLVVFQTYYAYQLFEWLAFHGYVKCAANTWELPRAA